MKRLLRHYWPELVQYRTHLLVMLLSMIMSVLAMMSMPYLFRNVAELMQSSYFLQPQNLDGLFQNLIYLGIAYLSMWVFWRINEYVFILFVPQAMRDMEIRAFQAIQKQSVHFFKEQFTGSLVKKIGRFTDAFDQLASIIYFKFTHELLKIIILTIIFAIEKPFIAILFLIWSAVFLIVSYLYVSYTLPYSITAAQDDSKVSGVIADSLTNFIAVKSFAKEHQETTRFKQISFQRYASRYKAWLSYIILNVIQAALMMGGEFILIAYSVWSWRNGEFTTGDFIFLQTTIFILFHSLWDFGREIQNCFKAQADAEEMITCFEHEVSVKDTVKAKKLSFKSGHIEIKNLKFTFKKDQKLLFRNFNLTIKAGQKVALVGPSGGGKSTLSSLLLRFYDIDQGSILIDGQNIAAISQQSLREHISFVPQAPDLFHRSISDNISFGKQQASKKEIVTAAKLAHAHEFIMRLPKGYETRVGERGVKLSGGERQRIAIARAFLENAPILILDEATSALDSITEKKIQSAILALMKNRTSIVIAHRLSTILHMDRILVIKNGQIVEDGTHNELLKQQGLYHKLWQHQVGGMLGEA